MDVLDDVGLGMTAKRELSKSEQITPFIEPLASCLHDPFLKTHCYSCFRRFDGNTCTLKCGFITYCSTECVAADADVYFGSGEHDLFDLLQNDLDDRWEFDEHTCPENFVSYLRLALRLLHVLPPRPLEPYIYPTPTLSEPFPTRIRTPSPYVPFPSRILGLSWNDPGDFTWVHSGAAAMSIARSIHTDTPYYGCETLELDIKALTLVITNAIRVYHHGPFPITSRNPIGIALYDYRISWFNHCCVPNSEVRFVSAYETMSEQDQDIELPIEPQPSNYFSDSLDRSVDLSAPCTVSQLLNGSGPYIVSKLPNGHLNYGPRAAVQTITRIQQGKEVTISYVDSSLPEVLRREMLLVFHKFSCTCRQCYRFYRIDSAAEDGDAGSSFRGEQVATMLENSDPNRAIVSEVREFFPSDDRDKDKLVKPRKSSSRRFIKKIFKY